MNTIFAESEIQRMSNSRISNLKGFFFAAAIFESLSYLFVTFEREIVHDRIGKACVT
jgi:hypothetical protein